MCRRLGEDTHTGTFCQVGASAASTVAIARGGSRAGPTG